MDGAVAMRERWLRCVIARRPVGQPSRALAFDTCWFTGSCEALSCCPASS